MNIVVINFSGNVGKSTITKHLLKPRLPKEYEFFSIESINTSGLNNEEIEKMKGKQFSDLYERMLICDGSVSDVGASNVEDFILQMTQFKGSHEDINYFIIPTIKDDKQVEDTISTIEALKTIGVDMKKVKIIFNRLENDETVPIAFDNLIHGLKDFKNLNINLDCFLSESEVYSRLSDFNINMNDLLNSEVDFKTLAKTSEKKEDRLKYARLLGTQRIAKSAFNELNNCFNRLKL